LAGTIPSSLSSLSQLTTLALYDNNLSGSIPSSLSSLSQLTYLGFFWLGPFPLPCQTSRDYCACSWTTTRWWGAFRRPSQVFHSWQSCDLTWIHWLGAFPPHSALYHFWRWSILTVVKSNAAVANLIQKPSVNWGRYHCPK
jgi:hypothetical protein